jgi:putative SOS response-associated peptidase YedK
MCYNYEALVRRGIKRAIREQGPDAVLPTLTEAEKRIWERKEEKLFSNRSTALPSESDIEARSTFPGAETVVIPITTKQKEYYLFGFLPDWAKSLSDKNRNFNARTDSLRVKPTWKKAWNKKQRCLVCAKGFYETDRATKKRYFFSLKEKSEIYFAGIFNHWTDKTTGEIFRTFAIITTEPNELVESIHNRMPVILTGKEADAWLDADLGEEEAFALLMPFPAAEMEVVSSPKPPRKKQNQELNFPL